MQILRLLFLCLFLSGCFSTTENRQALLKKKGIHNIKVGDAELTSRLIKNTNTGDDNSNNQVCYFNVRIDQLTDKKFEKEKLLYADFDIQNDFVLAAGKDSLVSTFCQKIENGRRRSYEYIVAFEIPKQKAIGDVTLVYNDKIFGVGTVAFVYLQNDLKNFEPKS